MLQKRHTFSQKELLGWPPVSFRPQQAPGMGSSLMVWANPWPCLLPGSFLSNNPWLWVWKYPADELWVWRCDSLDWVRAGLLSKSIEICRLDGENHYPCSNPHAWAWERSGQWPGMWFCGTVSTSGMEPRIDPKSSLRDLHKQPSPKSQGTALVLYLNPSPFRKCRVTSIYLETLKLKAPNGRFIFY